MTLDGYNIKRFRIRHWPASRSGLVSEAGTDEEKKGFNFISNRQRRGKKARNLRRGEVRFEPRTFG